MPDLDYGYEVTIAQNATFDPNGTASNQWQRKISGNTLWENINYAIEETYTVEAGDRSAKIRLEQSLNGAKAYSNELQVTSDPAAPPSGEGFGGFITCEFIGDGNYGGQPGDGMNDSGVKYLLILSPVVGGGPDGYTSTPLKFGGPTYSNATVGVNHSYGGIHERMYGQDGSEYIALSWVNSASGPNTLALGGYTDWYMPAANELKCIWDWRTSVPAGYEIINSNSIWSCSEYSLNSHNMYALWKDGREDFRKKGYTGNVRAVRRQKIS